MSHLSIITFHQVRHLKNPPGFTSRWLFITHTGERYKVQLPWLDQGNLSDNFAAARARLNSVLKRLLRIGRFKYEYRSVFRHGHQRRGYYYATKSTFLMDIFHAASRCGARQEPTSDPTTPYLELKAVILEARRVKNFFTEEAHVHLHQVVIERVWRIWQNLKAKFRCISTRTNIRGHLTRGLSMRKHRVVDCKVCARRTQRVHPEVVVKLMQTNGASQNLWNLLKGKPTLAELMRPIDKASSDVILQLTRSLQHVNRGQNFFGL